PNLSPAAMNNHRRPERDGRTGANVDPLERAACGHAGLWVIEEVRAVSDRLSVLEGQRTLVAGEVHRPVQVGAAAERGTGEGRAEVDVARYGHAREVAR